MPIGWLVRPSSVHSHQVRTTFHALAAVTTVPQIGRTKPKLHGNSAATIGGKAWTTIRSRILHLPIL